MSKIKRFIALTMAFCMFSGGTYAKAQYVRQKPISATTIQINTPLMYNNKYFESVLLPGQTLTIPVTVTNTGITSVEIIPYFAKYNLY